MVGLLFILFGFFASQSFEQASLLGAPRSVMGIAYTVLDCAVLYYIMLHFTALYSTIICDNTILY